MISLSKFTSFAVCLGLSTLVGCKSTSFDDSTTLVDESRAGTATYDRMFDDVVRDLVDKAAGQSVNEGKLVIAIMTVDSSAREELGSQRRNYLQQWLSSSLVNSGVFSIIDSSLINVAMSEAGISSEQKLLLPKYRRAFLEQLEGLGQTPQYFLYPEISASDSKAEGFISTEKQTTYQTSLKLVDTQNGNVAFSSLRKLPKSYSSYFGG